jgi:hypothetical protein
VSLYVKGFGAAAVKKWLNMQEMFPAVISKRKIKVIR